MVTTVVNVRKPHTTVTQISGSVIQISFIKESNRWVGTNFRPKNVAKAMGMKSYSTDFGSFLDLNFPQKRWLCHSKAVIFKKKSVITDGQVDILHFPVVREKLRTREIFYSSRIIFFGSAQFFSHDAQIPRNDFWLIFTSRKRIIILINANFCTYL